MKKILINVSSYLSHCFTTPLPLTSIDRVTPTKGVYYHFHQSSISLNTIPLPTTQIVTQPSTIDSFTQQPIVKDFFYFNNPDTYKNMLDAYINHHGMGSDKIKNLILEEQDIADRVYNIHTVTGNNTSPILLKPLKSKEYLSGKDISSIATTDGHSDSASDITVSLSPLGESVDITSLQDIITYSSTVFGG